jgi:hypothetical protein
LRRVDADGDAHLSALARRDDAGEAELFKLAAGPVANSDGGIRVRGLSIG